MRLLIPSSLQWKSLVLFLSSLLPININLIFYTICHIFLLVFISLSWFCILGLNWVSNLIFLTFISLWILHTYTIYFLPNSVLFFLVVFPFIFDTICKGTLISLFRDLIASEWHPEGYFLLHMRPRIAQEPIFPPLCLKNWNYLSTRMNQT